MSRQNHDLSTLSNGEINEKFNLAMEQVMENIMDYNTSPTAKRKITIELTLSPTEDRKVSMLSSTIKTKLANSEQSLTTIMHAKLADGKIDYREVKDLMYSGGIDENGEYQEANVQVLSNVNGAFR